MSLIGWWPLHEQNGQANDLSGNGNHGTVNGATQGVAGKQGMTAYDFKGGSEDIDFGFTTLEAPYTVSLWARVRSNNGGMALTNYNGTSSDYYMQFNSGGLNCKDEVNYGSLTTDNALSTNKWLHIVHKVDSSSASIFVNNEVKAYQSISSPSSIDNGYSFGLSSPHSDSYTFDGSIADFRIYNRALTPQEIQRLYHWGSRDYTRPSYHNGNDSGAVSKYKFGGDVKDSWGSNNGTDNTTVGYSSNSIEGKAKLFDREIGGVDIGSPGPSGALTTSAWINTDDTSVKQRIVNNYNQSSGEWQQLALQPGGDIQFAVDDDSTLPATKKDNVISQGSWYHVAGTFNGDKKVSLYLNGAKVDETVAGSTVDYTPSQDIVIGHRAEATGNISNDDPFNGKIDDVRLYNRALKPYEVQQLYQWGTRGRDMRKLLVNRRGD